MRNDPVSVFLCGDVMTGRGVDQILPHPGDPRLWESYTRDARAYVALAEKVNGPIPRPVDFSWPWGEALSVLADAAPEVRVINLETSITRSDDVAEGKAVTYRMAPENVPCLMVARPDVCALANNHVLDFGRRGLVDTIGVLARANVAAVGAGRDAEDAARPAVVPVKGAGRVIVYSTGMQSSGIPDSWAATPTRAGVDLVPEPPDAAADALARRMVARKRPGDVVIASIHWGSNWGYSVLPTDVEFAHRLVDGGVDIVHGHSSHHVRPIEVYRDKLILYGCGDLIDDYEGIGGYEEFRDDLRVLYFANVDPGTGRLVELRMVPMQARRMRLEHASSADVDELRTVLSEISIGSAVERTSDRTLALRPAG